jgi:hypothetical protein
VRAVNSIMECFARDPITKYSLGLWSSRDNTAPLSVVESLTGC